MHKNSLVIKALIFVAVIKSGTLGLVMLDRFKYARKIGKWKEK